MKNPLVLLAVAACAVVGSIAHGQTDGQCTVPLDLGPFRAQLEAAVADTLTGELADFGLAAPLQTVSPVADGVIGPGEYSNTCFFSYVDRENPGNPLPALDTIEDALGDDDLSLNLHMAHTDGFLFLGFEVTDEFLDLEEGVNAFTNDSIEAFFNPDLDIEDFNPDAFGRNAGGEGMQLVADAAGDGDIALNNRFTSGAGPIPIGPDEAPPGEGEFYTAGLPTDTGHIVEWQIPLASLDTDSDENSTVVPAKTGDVMLVNFVINDNDVEGAGGQDTHAMLWVVEDDPRSPFGGGENVWVVPLHLAPPAGEVVPALQAGDADQDLDFDQFDLIQVQQRNQYLSGLAATWGDGDWDGAPGGKQGEPPAGDGMFNQLDIIAALGHGFYLTGPYAALAGDGAEDDGQTSIIYNPGTGEVGVDAPAGMELTSINIDSAGGIFTGEAAQNLGGSFDNDADGNIFKATFGGSFGSLSFGNVAQAGLSRDFVLNDLTAVGSLAGGGALGDVDLIYVPEPAGIALVLIGAVSLLSTSRRRREL